MLIKYFQDTDSVHITFRQKNEVADTKELDENILLEFDKEGAVLV
jgi:uncharacterized protein YuzE